MTVSIRLRSFDFTGGLLVLLWKQLIVIDVNLFLFLFPFLFRTTDFDLETSADKPVSQGDEQELDSRSIKIQQKRFYIDVKQNQRGRFIKIAEVVSHDRKSRLLLSMSTAHEFKNHLTQFNDLYVTLGPQNPESAPNDGKFKTAVMTKDNRRYYLDLKENDRGRFLRVSIVRGEHLMIIIGIAIRLSNWTLTVSPPPVHLQQVSQTINFASGPRYQIRIPAQGMIEFRDALTELLDQYSTEEDQSMYCELNGN